jgi:arylsulfatase A-like enzyme
MPSVLRSGNLPKTLPALLATALCVLGGIASGPSHASSATPAATDGRPNIVVIVTDDQNEDLFKRRLMPHTFSLLGSGGARLNNFSVVTPLCCPSRSVQLTGQYGHNNGVLANDPGYPALRDPANVLPNWLRGAGYQTAHVGRFLNGYRRAGSPAAPAPGFDHWIGLMNLHYWNYKLSVEGEQRIVTGHARHKYVTRLLHRHADALVRELGASEAPFYLQLDELAPHDDHAAEDRCLRTALPGPDKLRNVRWVHLKRAALERNRSDKPKFIRRRPELGREELTEIQQRMRCRAGALREVDDGIGRLIRTLRRTGEFDDTVFMVYSDNGYFAGEHGLTKGKGMPYEQAVSVPALLRVPPRYLGGATPPRHVRLPTANIDIVPTLLELAGGVPCLAPEQCRLLDGRSMLPAMTDPGAWSPERPIVIEIDQPSRVAGATLGCTWTGLKRGHQVYVEYERVLMPDSDQCVATNDVEHYRLASDPRENHNLWPPQTRADAEAQRRLAGELDSLRTCAGSAAGPVATPNPCP